MLWENTLAQLFAKGGLVMWPLLACSVIGLAIIVERFGYFVWIHLHYGRFMDTLLGRLRSGDQKGALEWARGYRHPVARVARAYLENVQQPDALREDIVRREGSWQMELVEKRLRGLSAIAHLAPLLGLLGTVTGLVAAFHRIEILEGLAKPSDLAGGIWEALITTVFGLVIAIPCMAAYHGFENKADQIARRMQFALSELNEIFGKRIGVTPLKTGAGDELTAVQ